MPSKQKERCYCVTREINIWADTAEEAAIEALEILRDLASTATIFDVQACNSECKHHIDVEEVLARRNKK